MTDTDHVARLRGLTGPGVDRITLSPDSVRALEAALDELERLRAQCTTACACGCRRGGQCKCGPVGQCDCAWDCSICDRADATTVPLRRRPIPDRLDYYADKLGRLIDAEKVPRDTLLAIGATLVGLGAIASDLRRHADRDGTKVERELFAEVTRLRIVEAQLAETSSDGAQWQARERALAELREQIRSSEESRPTVTGS